MKRPQFSLRELLLVTTIAALALTIVLMMRAPPPPGAPNSTIFTSFTPESLFPATDDVVVTTTGSHNTHNPVAGYGWKTWQGTIASKADATKPGADATDTSESSATASNSNDPNATPSSRDLPAEFCKALEQRIAKASDNRQLTYWTTDLKDRKPGQPIYTEFMFNENEWHGEMFVWFFPEESTGRVGYAIYLREEPIEPSPPARELPGSGS